MISRLTNYSPTFGKIYQIKVSKDAFTNKNENPDSSDCTTKFTRKLEECNGYKREYMCDYDEMMLNKKKIAVHLETPDYNFTNANVNDESSYTFVVLTGLDKTGYIMNRFRKNDFDGKLCTNVPDGIPAPDFVQYMVRGVFEGKDITHHTIEDLKDLEELKLDLN